jgi:hypothetical protein
MESGDCEILSINPEGGLVSLWDVIQGMEGRYYSVKPLNISIIRTNP